MEKRVKYAESFVKEASKILTRNFKSTDIDLKDSEVLKLLEKSGRKIEAHIIGSIFNRYPIDSIYAQRTGEIKKSSPYLWTINSLSFEESLNDSYIEISIKNLENSVEKTVKYFPFSKGLV